MRKDCLECSRYRRLTLQEEGRKTLHLRKKGTSGLRLLLILLISAAATASLYARTDTEFDLYKLRIDGFWFYSNPTGSFQDATTGGVISLKRTSVSPPIRLLRAKWTGGSLVRTTCTLWVRLSTGHGKRFCKEPSFSGARHSMSA